MNKAGNASAGMGDGMNAGASASPSIFEFKVIDFEKKDKVL